MARLIGLLGGTFDPPHLGHLILADQALHELGLASVSWVLTPRSPLKPDLEPSPVALRRQMVLAALESNPRFQLSTIDLERPAPYYTVETLARYRSAEPEDSIALLIGSDALADLPRWHEPRRVVELCEALGVMDRPGHPIDLAVLDAAIPGLAAKVRRFRAPCIEISARDIRRRVAEGRSIQYLVPEAVRRVIDEEGLYRG